VKKLTLTLFIGLSLVLCGSAADADDGPQGKVLAQNSQAAPEAFQEAWTAEQPELDQSMILIADEHESCKMLCAHYDIKCCETSPTKRIKYCKNLERKMDAKNCEYVKCTESD
jgi:hypothetical protein